MLVFRRAAKAALAIAAVAAAVLLLSTCGGELAAGDPCTQADLGRLTTLSSGDVLECRSLGSPEQQAWVYVGHNASSGSLMWLGWIAAVLGVTAVTVGLAGILAARYGHGWPFRRLE